MSELIYNSGLVRPSYGGQLPADSATLVSLAKADQLNLLLQTGRGGEGEMRKQISGRTV